MTDKQARLWAQGQLHTRQQRWEDAIGAYRSIVGHAPDFVPAWLELSVAHEKMDAYRLARDAALQAARHPPATPLMALAVVRRLRRYEQICALFGYLEQTRLQRVLPPDKLVDLAMYVASAGAKDQALAWCEALARQGPPSAEVQNMLGLLRMFGGDFAASTQAFEKALALRPATASIFSVLARIGEISADNNHLPLIRDLIARKLPARDAVHLNYALHYELHALGEFDAAWDALERGWTAKLSIQPYDEAGTAALFDALTSLRLPPQKTPADRSGVKPIFIVGMYRSGTTLLERILAGHPDVSDAGETYAFSAQLCQAADHFCRTTADLALVAGAEVFDYEEIGRGFLGEIQCRVPASNFVTEKQNANFLLAGLIATALPTASLLHIHRDPLDVCFSNLRTLFTAEAAYSYGQLHVADYYDRYVRLMRHWSERFLAQIHDVRYGSLVEQPEATVRELCGQAGIQFVPDMLRVERQSGIVATASFDVARKGILKDRAKAWTPYAHRLRPLMDRLASHGLI